MSSAKLICGAEVSFVRNHHINA